MNVTFKYDPGMEVEQLKYGLTNPFNNKPSDFGIELQEAVIDITSASEVSAYISAKIASENIEPEALCTTFTNTWKPIEKRAHSTFKEFFKTKWEPGEISAYLTFSKNISYNVKRRFYFVSLAKNPPTPIKTTLHEVQHFYTHAVLQSIFESNNCGAFFPDFKEALTEVLNLQFYDALDTADVGYPQHKEIREWIRAQFEFNMSAHEISSAYITSMRSTSL